MVNKNKKEILDIIKTAVTEVLPGSQILLFGSQARNDSSEDSDYDFMVITRDTLDIREKRDYQSVIRKNLAKQKIPADIVIQSEDEVKINQEIKGHIVRSIIKEAIAI